MVQFQIKTRAEVPDIRNSTRDLVGLVIFDLVMCLRILLMPSCPIHLPSQSWGYRYGPACPACEGDLWGNNSTQKTILPIVVAYITHFKG